MSTIALTPIRYHEQQNELEFGQNKITLAKAKGYEVLDSNRVRLLSGTFGSKKFHLDVLADFCCETAENVNQCVSEILKAKIPEKRGLAKAEDNAQITRFEVHPDRINEVYYSKEPIYVEIGPEDQIDQIAAHIHSIRLSRENMSGEFNQLILGPSGSEMLSSWKETFSKVPVTGDLAKALEKRIISSLEPLGDQPITAEVVDSWMSDDDEKESEMDKNAGKISTLYSFDSSGKREIKSAMVITDWDEISAIQQLRESKKKV